MFKAFPCGKIYLSTPGVVMNVHREQREKWVKSSGRENCQTLFNLAMSWSLLKLSWLEDPKVALMAVSRF
jgi:hypothetical protein